MKDINIVREAAELDAKHGYDSQAFFHGLDDPLTLIKKYNAFRLTSSRLRKPLQDDVPYTTQALRQDLLRVRNAWDECQAHRERDAINHRFRFGCLVGGRKSCP
jgi:hypothetical protein